MGYLTIKELLHSEDHAWEELKGVLDQGKNGSVIITSEHETGADALYRLQVSTKSYLGAVAYETAGILFDHGWITLLGAGGEGIYGSLPYWNGLLDREGVPALEGMLLVGYDAAGGFFALNIGRFGNDGHVYYFAPDTLEWESMDLAYSGFVGWLADGDLDRYYETFRWQGWEEDSSQLQPGEVFAYYPPLWTKEGSGASSSRAKVSAREAWNTALNA
ncbi:DUF2625 domain-containing protein [Neobacillus mesonae]|nr:DUF2625 domain-containing protein [Neobacillus mesonae]